MIIRMQADVSAKQGGMAWLGLRGVTLSAFRSVQNASMSPHPISETMKRSWQRTLSTAFPALRDIEASTGASSFWLKVRRAANLAANPLSGTSGVCGARCPLLPDFRGRSGPWRSLIRGGRPLPDSSGCHLGRLCGLCCLRWLRRRDDRRIGLGSWRRRRQRRPLQRRLPRLHASRRPGPSHCRARGFFTGLSGSVAAAFAVEAVLPVAAR